MAVRLIDRAETVQIDARDRKRLADTLGARNLALERIDQVRAVIGAGQRIAAFPLARRSARS